MSTQEHSGTRTQDSSKSGGYQVDFENLGSEVMNLKNELAVQQAIHQGEQATQAAVQAGQATTATAAHAGQIAAGMSLIAGMVIGLLIGLVNKHDHIIRP